MNKPIVKKEKKISRELPTSQYNVTLYLSSILADWSSLGSFPFPRDLLKSSPSRTQPSRPCKLLWGQSPSTFWIYLFTTYTTFKIVSNFVLVQVQVHCDSCCPEMQSVGAPAVLSGWGQLSCQMEASIGTRQRPPYNHFLPDAIRISGLATTNFQMDQQHADFALTSSFHIFCRKFRSCFP